MSITAKSTSPTRRCGPVWPGPGARGRGALRRSAEQGRSSLQRASVVGQLAAAARDAELARHLRRRRPPDLGRGARLSDRTPGPVCGEQRARRPGADELPLVEPRGAEGEHRRRRGQPRERGGRFLRDVTRSPHLPASVDVTKFEVGGNLAVTPGSVVLLGQGQQVFGVVIIEIRGRKRRFGALPRTSLESCRARPVGSSALPAGRGARRRWWRLMRCF
jgi:hypothetical protein